MRKALLILLESSEEISAETFGLVLGDSLPQVCSFEVVAVKDLELPLGVEFCEKEGCIVDESACWGGIEVCYLQEGCPFLKRSRLERKRLIEKSVREGEGFLAV